MADTSDFTDAHFIYLGDKLLSDGELSALFVTTDPSGEPLDPNLDENVHAFSAKSFKRLIVGGVYTIRAKVNEAGRATTIIPTSAKFMKLGLTSEKRAEQQALHHAAHAQLEQLRYEKRMAGNDADLFDLLKPLQKAYWKTNPAGRRAIEIKLITFLRMERNT